VALVFFAASIAPVAIPWIARELGQQDPQSPEFIDHYAEQVGRIVSALAEATTATQAPQAAQDEGSPVDGEPQD
jgi:hypothetical protein